MDEGTNEGEHQQHGYYQYLSVPGNPRHVVQQQMSPARSPESFRRSATQSVRRSRAQQPPQTQAQAPSRGGASRRRIHRSSGTAASHHGIPPTTDPLRQNVALQFQQRALSPESVRHVQSQQIGYPAAQQQQQYDTGFLYGFDQSGTAQMTYGMSLPENLGGLPSGGARFSVPQQYFPSADDAESVSQYLSTQEQLAATYHQQQRSPLDRRIDTSTMASFNPTGSLGNMQQAAQQNMTNLEEAYNQYRQGLITVFGYTQRGHLNEGSRLLLDLSAWLIDNARDLGLFRDDPNTLTKHRQLWHEFNICWLSLCQKQKDLTESLLRNGGHRRRHSLQSLPATMLNADSLERMGQELIRLCDLVEPHGLVDYQMGIWEEEILDILGQCLDLIDT